MVDAPDVFIPSRQHPICDVPELVTGNRPADGGNLLIEEEDLPFFEGCGQYIRPFMGSMEFINNKKRWCLWLVGVSPVELRRYPKIMERVDKCRQDRENSPDSGRRKLALTPTLFREQICSENPYVIIPATSSERRFYIPIGYVKADTIASNAVLLMLDSSLYNFAILTSHLHNAWMRTVAGRLEMRYRYSKDIVYNNFPWPEADEAQQAAIGALGQAVLDARALYPECSLADLYDPLSMPPELLKAHRALDRAVLKLYGLKPSASEPEMVAELFRRYQELTRPGK